MESKRRLSVVSWGIKNLDEIDEPAERRAIADI